MWVESVVEWYLEGEELVVQSASSLHIDARRSTASADPGGELRHDIASYLPHAANCRLGSLSDMANIV